MTRPPPDPPTALPPASRLVMLVDDAPDNLKMLSDALDQAGYRVLVATDGPSAIERMDFVVPDIVLLDAVMPGMDGFETCRRIKAHARAARVPVVFMTGLAEPEHVVRGFQAGGIDYVTKPIETEVVLARLEAHLENARLISSAMDAMEAAANAVVVLDPAGRPAWKTARARQLLARHFGAQAADGLPPALQEWVAAALRRGPPDGTPGYRHSCGGRQLTLKLAATRKGEYVLLLEECEAPADADAALAAAYPLTAREREVLLWLAKGKTNRDISDILGMSPRTVNKHLEHIYIKLGVETRAAATALALTHLHRAAAGRTAAD